MKPCTSQVALWQWRQHRLEMRERTKLLLILAGFGGCWFLPVGSERFWGAVQESLPLVRWYAREHVLLCLVPAFFIAGALSVFVSQGGVMKYLGAQANKAVAYSVAAVSGTSLAVCSCTVLPLFATIHRRGAGLGPAIAFPRSTRRSSPWLTQAPERREDARDDEDGDAEPVVDDASARVPPDATARRWRSGAARWPSPRGPPPRARRRPG